MKLDILNNTPAKKQNKKVAVYPDGTRYTLRKSEGAWWWAPGKGSYPQSAAIENVKEAGGEIFIEKI